MALVFLNRLPNNPFITICWIGEMYSASDIRMWPLFLIARITLIHEEPNNLCMIISCIPVHNLNNKLQSFIVELKTLRPHQTKFVWNRDIDLGVNQSYGNWHHSFSVEARAMVAWHPKISNGYFYIAKSISF